MGKFLIVLFVSLLLTEANAQERIITAGSALTETVCALGDCDKIIASDRTSLYPEQIQKLPSIGYRTGINAEGILKLKPTLIIAEKNYVDDEVLSQLAASGVRLLIIDRKQTFEDTRKFIEQIATALGRQAEGKKLIAKNEALLSEASSMLKRVKSKPRVVAIYNRGSATVSLAAKNTFGDIIPYAGGVNAFGDEEGYKSLNTEALIAANPDFILMTSTGVESLGGTDGVLKVPGVAQIIAGQKKQIISIDALRLTNFGPRFGETVKELVLALHPELKVN